MRRIAIAASLVATTLAFNAHAETDDDDASPIVERPRAQHHAFELAAGLIASVSPVGTQTFHGSGVNGARVEAKGADLGYSRPLLMGFAFHGLYFPTPDFALGFAASGALAWGGESQSEVAAEVEPHGLTVVTFGPTAQFVLLDGPTSVRLGATTGLRGVSISIGAPEYRHANGRLGSAAAAELFVSPVVTVMQSVGRFAEIGASAGIEVDGSHVFAPTWTMGLIAAIRERARNALESPRYALREPPAPRYSRGGKRVRDPRGAPTDAARSDSSRAVEQHRSRRLRRLERLQGVPREGARRVDAIADASDDT